MKRYTEIIKNNYVVDNDMHEYYEEIEFIDVWERIYTGAAITKLGLLEDYIEGKITLNEAEEKFTTYLKQLKEYKEKKNY